MTEEQKSILARATIDLVRDEQWTLDMSTYGATGCPAGCLLGYLIEKTWGHMNFRRDSLVHLAIADLGLSPSGSGSEVACFLFGSWHGSETDKHQCAARVLRYLRFGCPATPALGRWDCERFYPWLDLDDLIAGLQEFVIDAPVVEGPVELGSYARAQGREVGPTFGFPVGGPDLPAG